MRRFLLIVTAAVAALMVSCATKGPTVALPVPPPKAVLVAPVASKVREAIATADRTAAAIDTGAKEAAKAATKARVDVERLKEKRTATVAELDQLWQDLQSLEARNLFLETQSQRLAANLTDARNTAATLQQVAAEKDEEATILRSQHAQISQTAMHYSDELDRTQKSLVSQRTRADQLAGEIRLYRLTLGIVALLVVLYVLAKILLPRFMP